MLSATIRHSPSLSASGALVLASLAGPSLSKTIVLSPRRTTARRLRGALSLEALVPERGTRPMAIELLPLSLPSPWRKAYATIAVLLSLSAPVK
jgi:hypothetical protein